jgi:outer membrane receptor protein involved in Fe transport
LVLVAAPKLRPETANTFEMSLERKLGHNWNTTLAVYHDRLSDLIQAYTPTGLPPAQYQNVGNLQSAGVEAEISGKLLKTVEASASLAFQNSTISLNQQGLPNSPQQVHKGRVGVPLRGGKFFLSGAVSYVSDRRTLGGDSVGSALVTDFTFTTIHLTPAFDIQAGVRNAYNDHYYDPVGFAIGQMLEDGRSAYVKLVWHANE